MPAHIRIFFYEISTNRLEKCDIRYRVVAVAMAATATAAAAAAVAVAMVLVVWVGWGGRVESVPIQCAGNKFARPENASLDGLCHKILTTTYWCRIT